MTSPSALLFNTTYHIYNRGNNRENIFIQERNYTYFMHLYEKYIDPVADTFAYCLLRNHFHVLVRVKSEQEILFNDEETFRVSKTLKVSDYPSRKFSNFFNAYAKSINAAYGRTGSLFQHPFGRVPIQSVRQFRNVIAYIHQNPQKHEFVDDFRDWKYSSYGVLSSDKPSRIQRETVLDWFGGREGYMKLNAAWVTEIESRWFAGDDDN